MSQSEIDKLVASIPPQEFIEGFRKGDPRIVHLIYELHFVKLCDFCYRIIGDSFEAEDIVSDLFESLLTVYRRSRTVGRSFNGMSDVVNYLYVAARNRCFNALAEQKKRRKIRSKLGADREAEQEELDLGWRRGLTDLKLLETIYGLQQRSIQVLRKLYFEDMSYEEVAADMKISRATVSNLRQQGIRLLARKLKPAGLIFSFWLLASVGISIIL